MARSLLLSLVVLLLVSSHHHNLARAQQDYDDYADDYNQDSLYHDYAARQQAKENGGGRGGAGVAGAAGGWGKMALGGVVGWFVGAKIHSGRLKKKLNAKFKDDQKKVYQQYYNDVYALQQQNAELIAALEQTYGTQRTR